MSAFVCAAQTGDLLIRQIGSWLIASNFSLKRLFNYPRISSRCMFEYFLQFSGDKTADVVVLTSMIDPKKRKDEKTGKAKKKLILSLVQTPR